jgi:hypothetical protein
MDPPPPPAERRFLAKGSATRRIGLWVYGGMAVMMGAVAAINLLPSRVASVVTPVVFLAGLGAYGVWLVWGIAGRRVVLDVGDERVVVDEGRGGSFTLAGAKLGLWRMAGISVTSGTALHLAGGEQPFVIGGQDHRPGPAIELEAAPVVEVDAILPASQFEALLAELPSWVFRARWDAASFPAPLRVELTSNPWSTRHVLGTMLPWLSTIALLIVLTVPLEAAGISENPLGRAVTTPLMIALVVAGMVLTVVRARRRRRGLELELGEHEIRLLDSKRGAVLVATPLSTVQVARGRHVSSGRGASSDMPTLRLRLSPAHEVSVGVYDTRYGWSDVAPRVSAPRWVIGPPDWNTLVERLGVRPFLVVQELG